ncbi:NAD-dependent deacetylase [Gordonia sp. HY002]|uniref:Sir2 family NAD-dependent protein deacetylase n=1 Tax=Gordonia zhenghanii TaxID=2911516 RepID=UPI001EF07047|nr:Sir2 family NAD-dependent protein deacetylase [Gordonia zhenghanii]MCF8569504.1 NAD-dependent deacetylase [Gordonia zhenghanii]MCF8603915.1 NAD-dependent deacetylase [Gordonia zhenghanii]
MRTRVTAWTPAPPTLADTDPVGRASLATRVLAGRRTVVLTGAGVSTPSGIPDYRSPDAVPRNPMTIEQFLSSADFRRHYWARNHLGWRHMDAATPNAAHRAITDLQRAGVATGVITQNVDMLHLKAGSRPVLDIHGSYGRVICLSCGHTQSRHLLAQSLEEANPGFADRVRGRGAIEVAPDADAVLDDTSDFTIVDCAACGGVLKPDIVYFGESVPRPVVDRAFAMVDDADAMLVAGSSLSVMSGLRFVRHAARSGKPVVIVNRGRTRGDDVAAVKIDHRCEAILPMLVDLSRASARHVSNAFV